MSLVYNDDSLYKDYLVMQKDSLLSDMKDSLNKLLTTEY